MKLIHSSILSLTACLGFWSCANTQVKNQTAIRLNKTTYNYGASALGDSSKHRLVWQSLSDFRSTAGGAITFESVNNNTIVMLSGIGGASKDVYHRVKLSPKDDKKVPKSFLNGSYKLIGVFDQEATKGYFYISFYTNGTNLFAVWQPAIGFLLSVDLYTNQPVNDFEKAGIVFPYSNKIRF